MNETRTIEQLERDLHRSSGEVLPGPVLAEIRSRGKARRRNRLVAYAGGVAAGIVAAGVLVGVVADDGDVRDPAPVADSPPPKEMSPLAERALREIPGAVQVSPWQVLLPTPVGGGLQMGEQRVPDDYIEAGPVDIGARSYTGVTSFKPAAFPAWLYDGVEDIEKNELGSEEEGYPVGSTEMGIIVDAGPVDLACIRRLPQWTDDGGEAPEPQTCLPAMLGQAGDHRTYDWGMGTDDFLDEGEGLELFSTDIYSSGAPQTVWIGGTDGTEVATVTLVTTDGTEVEGTVASGTLVPDETMFWGTVSGELAVAVTRDADGEVLERHELKPCSSPVDCEVR